MATLCIQPIAVTTRGGFAAVIDGIDPVAADCLSGRLYSGQDVRWDLSGTATNLTPDFNLDIQSDEVMDVVDLARHLNAK